MNSKTNTSRQQHSSTKENEIPTQSSSSLSYFLQELKTQSNIAIPTTIGLIFYKLPWMISLHFVGAIGAKELAAAALATSLCNVTGMSLSVGLSSAITTLAGQARGHLFKLGVERSSTQQIMKVKRKIKRGDDLKRNVDDSEEKKSSDFHLRNYYDSENTPLVKHESGIESDDFDIDSNGSVNETLEEDESPLLPLVFLYRGLIIQLGIVIPIGLWWISGIEPMLLSLGQSAELSKMTSVYLRILTPGLWSYSINLTMTAWLQSIEIADVPAYTAFIGFACHIPLNILYVRILGFGYEGVAMATVSFQILQPLLMFVYLFGTNQGVERILSCTGATAVGRTKLNFWSEVTTAVASFSGIKQYLELGLPGMIAISEWWASETCIFLAGTFHPNPDYAVGAMSIYQSINTFCFMFPGGFNRAASARVAMFLGKNKPADAYFASKISLLCAGLLSFTIGNVLYFTPHKTFPSLFTSDHEVVSQTTYTIPFLAFYVFADGLQICLQGIIIGCGKQFVMAPVVLFSYWLVGVPLGYYNAFMKNDGVLECDTMSLCGVRGLVFGLLTGTWIHMLLFMAIFVFAINWKKEAELAQARMMKQNKGVISL